MKNKIIEILIILLEQRTNDYDLLAILGSYGDTLSDKEIYQFLKFYLEDGTIWEKVYERKNE